jgi:pantetheine-phosphate adenylyltransferase|uniref:Phosphopantetheine adenylyltransferase n=1 Tax=candidate division WOR-3 bacterium TaxID=2052148 RepID=A0A7C4TI02_UNCW3
MKKAVYAGTFDPITYGHIDVINRAIKIFDRIIIGVSDRPKKTLFTLEERIAMIDEIFKNEERIMVKGFSCLLVDFAKSVSATTIIRGIRAVSDFDYEFQLALMNRKLNPEIETLFLMPSENYIFISSSLVKEIASLGGDVSKLVPPVVKRRLEKKFNIKL